MVLSLILVVVFAVLALATFAEEGGPAPAAAGSDAGAPGQDAARDTALANIDAAIQRTGLPSTLPESGEATAGGEQPTGEQQPKPAEAAADKTGALGIDPRLMHAAERLGWTEEQIAEQLKMFGKEPVEKALALHADALDKHAAALGQDGRKKEDGGEEPAEEPAETGFKFADEVWDAYGGENGDLLGAIESGTKNLVKPLYERQAAADLLQMRMLARQIIRDAGDAAKGVDRTVLLDKAETLAAGYAQRGQVVDPEKCLEEALANLTQGKAAEAARRDLAQKVGQRARQVSGAPTGRTPLPASGPEAHKRRAIAAIEKKMQEHGIRTA
jgi:hypothetical protein